MFFKILIFCLVIIFNYSISADQNRLIIASTTSTYDTGLLSYLNKEFIKEHDITIHVLALGTGQAIKVAEQGNADILLVHHTPSEIKFIKDGYGIKRFNLMYNDFIIVGPKQDSLKCDSIKSILEKISNDKILFLSRGDDSGTHKKEISLWNSIELDPKKFTKWYKKVGQGMGSTIFMANEMLAYTLTDRSTWVKFNKKENLKIICENKPPLFNQYGIIGVNPDIDQSINYEWANTYISWIISARGKKLINNYKVFGKQLFFFNYK